MNIADFIEEFMTNKNDTDILNLIADDNYVDINEEENMLSEDIAELNEYSNCYVPNNNERGTSQRTFSTTSRNNFDSFYYFLLDNDYEVMRSSDEYPYKVYVFGLTKEQATLLEKIFYGNKRLRPLQSTKRAA